MKRASARIKHFRGGYRVTLRSPDQALFGAQAQIDLAVAAVRAVRLSGGDLLWTAVARGRLESAQNLVNAAIRMSMP